jgi:hypothetical protein
MKHKNVLRLSEAFDREDALDLKHEFDSLPKGDDDDAEYIEDEDDSEEDDLDAYFSAPKRKHEDDDDYSTDLDDLAGPDMPEDTSDFYEPTYDMPEEPAAMGTEARLRELQAELRELPKGDPRKKEIAAQILDMHKQLSQEDDDYTKRHLDRMGKMKGAEVKRQDWIDKMMDEPGEQFESAMVLKCSEFILLEKKRAEVMKDADKKYPNLSKSEMKKMLKDQEAGAKDFKTKAKKYFGWAKDPEAAAAAFIRKASGKEPKDA